MKIRIGLMIFTIMLVSFGLTPHLWGAEFKEFEKINEEMEGYKSHMGKVSKNRDELYDATERYANAKTDKEKLAGIAGMSKALLKQIKGKDDALIALRRGISRLNAANATDSSDGSQLDNFLGGRITDIKVSYKEFRAESDEIKRAAKFSEDGKLTKAQESLVTILDHQAAKLEEFVKNCEKNMKYGDLDAEGVAKIRMTVLDKWRLTFTAVERELAASLTHDEVQLRVMQTTYESLDIKATFEDFVRKFSPGEEFSISGMIGNIGDASRRFDTTMAYMIQDLDSIVLKFEWEKESLQEEIKAEIAMVAVAPQAGDVKDKDMVYEYWDPSKKRWFGTSDGKIRTRPHVYAPYSQRRGSGLYVEYKEEEDAWYTFYLGGPSGDELIYERIFTESELGLSPDEEL